LSAPKKFGFLDSLVIRNTLEKAISHAYVNGGGSEGPPDFWYFDPEGHEPHGKERGTEKISRIQLGWTATALDNRAAHKRIAPSSLTP